MSTKTSIKRIALVAVSALGFGLLSVVPAKAAEATNAEVAGITLTAALANTYAVNSAQTFTVGFTDNDVDATDSVSINYLFNCGFIAS